MITVTNVNQAPAVPTVTGGGLSGTPASGYTGSVAEGGIISFTVAGSDPDVGDSIEVTTNMATKEAIIIFFFNKISSSYS